MITAFANLFALLTIITGSATAVTWEKLFVAFGDAKGLTGMPITRRGLLEGGYGVVDHSDDLNVDFYSYKDGDKISVAVDSYGNIAGVRVSYKKSAIGGEALDNGLSFNFSYYDNDPMYSSGKLSGEDAYHNTILFVDPDTLKKGGRNGSDVGVGKDLFVRLNGNWTKMPNYECKLSLGFTQGLCFPVIGKHYIYGLSSNMDCMDFKGLMVMYEAGDLTGFGLATFGSSPGTSFGSRVRKYLSSFTSKIIPDISDMIPGDKPKCLAEWITNYGISTVHFFFSKNPLKIICAGKTTIC